MSAERMTPANAGTILEGASLRTADELCLAVLALAFHYGMPEDEAGDRDAAERGDGEYFHESAGDLANDAQEWLTEHVAPEGYAFMWDDGLVLRETDDA